jgi:hypothetical protein
MDMESVLLYDDDSVDIANGRYIVLGKGGKAVAQDDDLHAVMEAARAMGIECPAVVDLEITRGGIHVY